MDWELPHWVSAAFGAMATALVYLFRSLMGANQRETQALQEAYLRENKAVKERLDKAEAGLVEADRRREADQATMRELGERIAKSEGMKELSASIKSDISDLIDEVRR